MRSARKALLFVLMSVFATYRPVAADDCVKETPFPDGVTFAVPESLGRWARYQGVWSGVLEVNNVKICRTLAITAIDQNGDALGFQSWGSNSAGTIRPGYENISSRIENDVLVHTSSNRGSWTYTFSVGQGSAEKVTLQFERPLDSRSIQVLRGDTTLQRIAHPISR